MYAQLETTTTGLFIAPATETSSFCFSERRDGGERQRRKMTTQGEALSLVVQNLRPGTFPGQEKMKLFDENLKKIFLVRAKTSLILGLRALAG